MNADKFITFNKILIILIATIAGGMLVFNRIDTESHLLAVNSETGEIVKRGEIMTTSDDYAIFDINDSIIYLSKNTELKLIDGRENNIDLQLIQGRIVISGNAKISIRGVDISSQGLASIVHYSWLDEIEVATMDGSAVIQYSNQVQNLDNEAIRMSTLEPYTTTFIDFEPEQSSEKEFYKWVILQINL